MAGKGIMIMNLLKRTKYISQTLTQKQEIFLRLNDLEALYHGSDGSITLLFVALQYVDLPGYNALILSPTYAMCIALRDVSCDLLGGTDANIIDGGASWRFPSGARIFFSCIESAKDKYRYVGTSWQYIGWDNIAQFAYQSDYTFLFGYLRRSKNSAIPLRVRTSEKLPKEHKAK